ncbi:MAG: heavy-metal-associated domain-containing protein [Bacteroidales bacterium]|jgi:copper chaperone CopZ|nr:heavy-metal-associated domain-containing protein [Bacteroidales bacterium]
MKKLYYFLIAAVTVAGLTGCWGEPKVSKEKVSEDEEVKTTMTEEKHEHKDAEALCTVNGACGMCKTRIESAAKTIDGVSSAEYDLEAQKLKIKYCDHTTDKEAILTAIAKAGHDNEMFKASDEVYDKLPECCKYRGKDKKE